MLQMDAIPQVAVRGSGDAEGSLFCATKMGGVLIPLLLASPVDVVAFSPSECELGLGAGDKSCHPQPRAPAMGCAWGAAGCCAPL